MKNTTLCYIENNGAYLMLYRNKKINDINHEKWIGVGGKFQDGESPHDCARREIAEETGYKDLKLSYRGIVTFVSDEYGTEYMHLFTANAKERICDKNCPEGTLVWVDKEKIGYLPIWEGDKIFFKLLESESSFFSLKLQYKGEKLISADVEK